ncbi:SRPBCC family protein [Streptomyces sp. NPDC047725]|uniref:SRPBCC family protein n=1 Tax=Streptomyces sp. NPDC047725 TaxID=3365487 RepID=UPI0037101623
MIDVRQQIDSVHRRVGRRALEAGDARVLTVSRTFGAPLDEVWSACTDPERIPQWFLPVSGDLREGGHYQLEGNAGGTIERCEPPAGFAATWEYRDEISRIAVALTPVDGGTRFELEYLAHAGDERWAEYGPGAVGIGWDLMLVGLTLYLSTGAPVDPREVMAWQASEDGVRFVSSSSEAWYEAAVASGADPAQARLAAYRTTAFYTGADEPGGGTA